MAVGWRAGGNGVPRATAGQSRYFILNTTLRDRLSRCEPGTVTS